MNRQQEHSSFSECLYSTALSLCFELLACLASNKHEHKALRKELANGSTQVSYTISYNLYSVLVPFTVTEEEGLMTLSIQ